MSNPNSPDSGDTAWQEYLTGGGQAGDAAGASGAGGADLPGELPGPRRVIGTPPPATARTMLPATGDGGPSRPVRELPPDPDNPATAKKAELIVAACFILAMLAGFGFLVAYGIIGVGSITGAQHSNLVLGATLSVTLLLLGIGATIWVRQLMPSVELTEQRHVMGAR